MKFNLLPLLVAGATFVAAAPLRVILVTSQVEQISHGPAASVPIPPIPSHHRKPCGAGAAAARFHEKALDISNAFRQALGMPQIEPHHHHMAAAAAPAGPEGAGLVHIMPFPFGDHKLFQKEGSHGDHKHGEHHKHPHPHHHKHHSHPPNATFTRRLHNSLMNLGRWEARAVAFVLGCGIGVLLRMFFMMAILIHRSIRRGSTEEHEHVQYHVIHVYDDAEELAVPPPHYIVDEKAPIVDEA